MSLFEDTYKTIASSSEGIVKNKGSKFIAYAYPLANEDQVKELVAGLKSEHPKARHHCWAYRLTSDRSVYRMNDDGEPSGTAGRPILNTLLSHDLTNILVVVVRYFGGTLLGVPGLIHAYKTATQEALQAAQVVELTVNDIYRVSFGYEQLNDVMRIVKDEGIGIRKQVLDNRCLLELEIRQQQTNRVLGRLQQVDGAETEYVGTR